MNEISIWVLSISGVIVLTAMFDLILPNSSISHFVKNIFSFVLIIVIFSPVVSFFSKGEYSFETFMENKEIQIQNSFIQTVNDEYIEYYQKLIQTRLCENNFSNIQIGIKADVFNENFQINEIVVDLSNFKNSLNLTKIERNRQIIEIIQNILSIDEEKILFYE